MQGIIRIALLGLCAAVLAGCGSSAGMRRADTEFNPVPDKALVVVMRSTFVGSAISASVWDVTGPETKFIGILDNGTKLAHYLPPGEHTLMVIGESADFMKARVSAGKEYYALVTPRMGVWKARFSFRPLRRAELEGADFKEWDAATHFVTNTPESQAWAAKNLADVQAKRNEYWPAWSAKPAAEQAEQSLTAADGR